MSLMLLVIIVVAGITLIAASVHFTGGTVTARMDSPETALQRFAQDFEGEQVGKTILSADHQTAFLWLESGLMGIVHAIGDSYLTRILSPGELRSVRMKNDKTVAVLLRDVTWRGGEFAFEGPGDADAVYRALDGIRSSGRRKV